MSNQSNFTRTHKKKSTIYLKPHSFNTPVIGATHSNVRVPNIEDKNSFNKTLTSSNNLTSKFSIIEPLDKPMIVTAHQHKNSSSNLSSLINCLNEPSKVSHLLSNVKAVSSSDIGDSPTNQDNHKIKPLQKQSSKAFLKLIIDEEDSKLEENEYKELSYFKEEGQTRVVCLKKKNSLVIRGR